MIYTGWIAAIESDRAELESFGIVVGPYNADSQTFDDCVVNESALRELDRRFGSKYIYSLNYTGHDRAWTGPITQTRRGPQ